MTQAAQHWPSVPTLRVQLDTHMRTLLPSSLSAALLCLSSAAQSYLYLPATRAPQTNELAGFRIVPLMRPSARVQMFYDVNEVGQTSFVVNELALRYDGPIPPVGAPGPFTVQRVRVDIGTTTVAIPGPAFAANLSQPLTNVFDARLTYLPDNGTSGPEPWGGPGGDWVLQFNQPVAVTIPTGGLFVVDFRIEGNDLNGQAHTMLDAAIGSGGAQNGSAVSTEAGCPATQGGQNATILTSGVHAPGGVHSIHGSNLGASAPVFVMVGLSDQIASFGPLPLPVPGSSCQIYTSAELTLPLPSADVSGRIAAFANGTTLALPAVPSLTGGRLYEQLASFVPGANPLGLVFSDKRSITLGTLTPPAGFYAVSHGFDANSPVADDAVPFGYALRLRTQ